VSALLRRGADAQALDSDGDNMLYYLNDNNNLTYDEKVRLAEKLYALMQK